MLISCCHYNWFVELVSTMGGKILRGTVHVVIFFLVTDILKSYGEIVHKNLKDECL